MSRRKALLYNCKYFNEYEIWGLDLKKPKEFYYIFYQCKEILQKYYHLVNVSLKRAYVLNSPFEVWSQILLKALAKKFEVEFNCLEENTEKYKTFSALITEEVKRSGKNGEEDAKTISSKFQFIDLAEFMATSFSNLVDNLAREIHEIKCIDGHNNKKRWNVWNEIKKIRLSWLNTQTLKMI